MTAARTNVLLLGDSRMAEGFSAKIADRTAIRLHFFNAAVPGASPRCWYYLMRDMDPDRSRFGAIVLPIDDYDDEDGASDWADWTRDTHVVIFCLRLGDLWDYATSFHSARSRFEAWRDAVLKGFILKQDVGAFLAHPAERLKSVHLYSANFAEWNYLYEGHSGTVSVEEARDAISRPTLPQNGRYAQYRRLWFGRMIDHYRGKPVRFIFARVPAAPLRRPHPHVRFSRVIPALQSPGVTVLAENSFASLERPEYFFDTVHLNAEGRKSFSAMLAQQVSDALSLP